VKTHLSIARLAWRSLLYYRRSNLAVLLGVAVGVAALVGSLLVGDSVKASLRALSLERLGRVTHALAGGEFLPEDLAERLSQHTAVKDAFDVLVPVVVLDGAAKAADSGVRVPRVTVIGVRADFARLGRRPDAPGPQARSVILNRTLADDLGIERGEALLVAVGRRGDAPVESVFGRKGREDTVRAMRLTVGRVIPSEGLGLFSLRRDEPRPRNLYIDLAWLQRQLKRPGSANAILAVANEGYRGDAGGALADGLRATVGLADYGLRLVRRPERGVLSLESGSLALPPNVVRAGREAARACGLPAAPVSIYLANSLAVVGRDEPNRAIPYSTVAGLAWQTGTAFAPPSMARGDAALGPEDILLNAWAADDLGAVVGNRIEMTFYVAGRGGRVRTERRTFALRGIAAMTPSALDPTLVPDFEGITDAKTMAEWRPPFPIDLDRIRPKDEAYWERYRAAPKAFVSLETARDLWRSGESPGTAGGGVTSLRLAPQAMGDLEQSACVFGERLLAELRPEQAGLVFRPVRELALASAAGSTDFGVLFVSMSFFLMAAAVALVALLVRLAIERRASEYGLLLACGFTSRRASLVCAMEVLFVAVGGAVIGSAFGVGYAGLILRGLRTWWAPAAGRFVFSLHVSASSLLVGSATGLLIAWATVVWSTRVLTRVPAVRLLAGWRALGLRTSRRLRRRALGVAVIALALGGLVVVLAAGAELLSVTGAFFGGGAALLVGTFAWLAAALQRPARTTSARRLTLIRLAWWGASRNWLRSLLTAGLLACASFILVAVAANRKDLTRLDTRRLESGAGGFNLMAVSDLPLYHDLSTEEGRRALGFSAADSARLEGAEVFPLRVLAGDDVSCLNMQRPVTPRVLGVPAAMVARGGFAFSKALALPPGETTPWALLERDLGGATPVIPAIADAASAQWILHLGLGDEMTVAGRDGGPVRLRLVALLTGSVFAGELLVSERHFEEYLGEDAGYRAFLLRTPSDEEKAVMSTLREGLGELGCDVRRTGDILADYGAVQNTYLATFQTLGGLGLLLGTFGLVTVLLRSVVERRNELAMMLALGLRRVHLVVIIVLENAFLLVLGVLVGTVAALVAVTPHLLSSLAEVAWSSLAGMLLACILAGLVSCAVAATVAMRGEILPALRSE